MGEKGKRSEADVPVYERKAGVTATPQTIGPLHENVLRIMSIQIKNKKSQRKKSAK